MAELTDETVQKLTQILERYGKDEGSAPGGPTTDTTAGMREQSRQADRTADRFSNLREEIDELEASYQRQADTQTKFQKQMKVGEAIAQQYQDSILGVSSEFQKMIQFMPKSIGQIAGMAKEMLSFKGVINTVSGILLKIVSNTLDFALSVDRASASFRAATGAGYGYERVISNAGAAYLTYGINAEDAAAATTELFSSFRDFTNLSRQEKDRIVATTAILQKMGVSVQLQAKSLDIMTKSLGMGVTESERTLREFESIAQAVGKPMSEIAADFASAAPKLAFYGKQAVDVFKELEAQSKSTGLSVDQLMNTFGDQFDTFEGAGTAVGKLNALLGGPYLNSIDMLNAKEHERVEMLQESFKATGLVFDNLNKFERKAFASAIGTDVDTLSRSLRELSPYEQAQILRQEQLARKAGQTRDIIQKLKDAFQSFIIANQPLVDEIVKLVDRFSDWVQKNHDLSRVLEQKVMPHIKQFGSYLKDVVGPFMKDTLIPLLIKAKDNWKLLVGVWLAVNLAGPVAQVWRMVAALRAMGAAQMMAGGGPMMGPSNSMFARSQFGRMGMMGRMGMGALGAAGAYGAYATHKGLGEMKDRGASQGSMTAMGVLGGAGSGAAMGAALGSFIPVVGTALGAGIGAGIGAGVGYFGAQNDGTQVYHDGKLVAVGNNNSSDNFMIHAGTPTGPLSRNGGVFGQQASAGQDSQMAQLLYKNVAEPLIRALQNKEFSAEITGDISKFLDIPNTNKGKEKYMPFYNR